MRTLAVRCSYRFNLSDNPKLHQLNLKLTVESTCPSPLKVDNANLKGCSYFNVTTTTDTQSYTQRTRKYINNILTSVPCCSSNL